LALVREQKQVHAVIEPVLSNALDGRRLRLGEPQTGKEKQESRRKPHELRLSPNFHPLSFAAPHGVWPTRGATSHGGDPVEVLALKQRSHIVFPRSLPLVAPSLQRAATVTERFERTSGCKLKPLRDRRGSVSEWKTYRVTSLSGVTAPIHRQAPHKSEPAKA